MEPTKMEPMMEMWLEKANVLIEALPYIQRFHGKTIVVKYGGSAMVDHELKKSVIRDVALLKLVGFRPIIVHGGGKEITKWINKVGLETNFVNGLRVTDAETMEVAEMVLNKINKGLVSMMEKVGLKAVGISGKDGSILQVDKKLAGGKDMFTIQGEYNANMIRKAFGRPVPQIEEIEDAPGRPPLLCAGCPHRGLFHVLSKLKKTVIGDIGCYTLASLPPTSAMDSCLCMGASITMAHGFEKAVGSSKDVVAVLGDSTFFHSGITGLVNMNYNGAKGTVIILDNRITGMTGHQDNPSTGRNAKGQEAPAIDIAELCRAIGVKNIVEIDPFKVKELEEIIKTETAIEELSVIITKRPCALIVKQPDTPYEVTDKCRNCKMCMKIGCPAIEERDGKPYVVPESCVGCGLCAEVCPFDAFDIKAAGKEAK